MAVVKMTKTKNSIQFIDDEGNVFGTSRIAIQNLLSDHIKGNFVLLTKYPWKASPDRFKKSEVWYPPGYIKPKEDKELKVNDDSFSQKGQELRKKKKMFSNLEVL